MEVKIIAEIDKKRNEFLSVNNGYIPEYLYLGETALKAFLTVMNSSSSFLLDVTKIKEKKYKGMKILEVLGEDAHINCA